MVSSSFNKIHSSHLFIIWLSCTLICTEAMWVCKLYIFLDLFCLDVLAGATRYRNESALPRAGGVFNSESQLLLAMGQQVLL